MLHYVCAELSTPHGKSRRFPYITGSSLRLSIKGLGLGLGIQAFGFGFRASGRVLPLVISLQAEATN